MQQTLMALLAVTVLMANTSLGRGQNESALEAIRSVGPLGKGNPAAASGWKALVSKGAEGMIPALESLNDDSALAANWLRPALDAMAEKAKSLSQIVPVASLEAFVRDRKKGRFARACALELIEANDEAVAAKLIGEGLDDPSGEIRRKAIGMSLEKIQALPAPEHVKALKSLFDQAADTDQVEKIAKELKQKGIEVSVREQMGYLTAWSLIGPFANTGNEGFVNRLAPEDGVRLGVTFLGAKGDVGWKDQTTDDKAGVVDLNKSLGDDKSVVAFAFTRIRSDREQRVQLRVGSITSVKLFLNGAKVYEHDEYHHGMSPDQYIAEVILKPGVNELMLKIGQNDKAQSWEKNWQFQARFTDLAGARAKIQAIGPR